MLYCYACDCSIASFSLPFFLRFFFYLEVHVNLSELIGSLNKIYSNGLHLLKVGLSLFGICFVIYHPHCCFINVNPVK